MSETMFEPFAGSLAVLLKRPHAPGTETVNDRDGFICNVFRALAADPEQVAHYADWPAMANDLHARHVWLKTRRAPLSAQLEGDPDYYDAKIAGWWLWGVNLWIGGGWCSTEKGGPWHVEDGQLVRQDTTEAGVKRLRLQLGNAGQGVHRKLLRLSRAGSGVHLKRLHLGDDGTGVRRGRLHLGDAGQGMHAMHASGHGLLTWFAALQARLRRTRVECGDWLRVMGPAVLEKHGLTGVVLDPPYSTQNRYAGLYGVDDGDIAAQVCAWAIAHGDNPLLRIALCGYAGEHTLPSSWECVPWKAHGGMGNQGHGRGRANKHEERVWFSPACLPADQSTLFTFEGATP